MKSILRQMERVGVRDVWASESHDFTPWLAENLSLLGDTIGMELGLEAQEKSVGPFRADILAKDVVRGTWVLIENQLEETDHGHLGQLLTYAAGLQAATIVWIASRFTNEHRAALHWFNDIAHETVRCFGLEIEVWRIGDQVAPKLNVICAPKSWSKVAARPRQNLGGLRLASVNGSSKPSAVRLAILTVLQEHYPETMTPREIARKTQFSLGSIKMALSRMAREKQVLSSVKGQYTLP